MTTAWHRLPPTLGGSRVVVIAAGTLDRGNSLVAAYGATEGAEIVPVGAEPLTDAAGSPSWRTFVLSPPAGADAVRIEAADRLAGQHEWLAFSAPVVARPVAVSEIVSPDEPVALAWQVAFGFPCLRPSAVVHGITEPPEFGVLRAGESLGGLGDVAWQGARGGVFAQVVRTQSVLQLATVAPADPYLQVYAFGTPLARDAYTLTAPPRTVWGGSTGEAQPR
jgi:arabinosyltransferase C